MASPLLRSAARELRRSIPPPRPASRPLMEGLPPRLLSTDSSNHKMSPSSSSSSLPDAAQSRMENLLCSYCAGRIEINKVKEQFSADELLAFKRYMCEKMKQTKREYFLSLDEFSDALEERSALLRQIKVLLEAGNRWSAKKLQSGLTIEGPEHKAI